MTFQDVLQHCVVRGNRVWPIAQCNRFMYRVAVRRVAAACRRISDIRAVYLLHSMAQGHWVPGLSDIDLTVLIDDQLSEEEEFTVLREFWASHDRVKRLSPMLGHVNVLTAGRLAAWIGFTFRGFESQQWQPIFGDAISSSRKRDNAVFQEELVNFVVTLYLWHFPTLFFDTRPTRYVYSALVKRVADKICRYASGANPTDKEVSEASSDGDEFDQMSRIIHALEPKVRADLQTRPAATASIEAAKIAQPEPSETLPVDTEVVESVLANGEECFVILREGLSRDRIRSAIVEMLDALRPQYSAPFVMSAGMFEYMLRFNAPYRYTALASKRQVLGGRDPLNDLPPPDYAARARGMLRQLGNVVEVPGRQLFHRSFSAQTAESYAYRALFIRRFLDSGQLEARRLDNIAACGEQYPEESNRLTELLERPPQEESRQRFAWFQLLRRLADGIVESAGARDLAAVVYSDGRCAQ